MWLIDPFETKAPFLHLISIRNGRASAYLGGFGNVTFIAVSIVMIMSVILYLMLKREDKLGLSLIPEATAIYSRVISGSVTDFTDVFAGRFHWPAFNVADSALSIGLAVMIVRSVFIWYRKKRMYPVLIKIGR